MLFRSAVGYLASRAPACRVECAVSLVLKIADLSSQPRTEQGVVTTSWCAERMAGLYRAVAPEQTVTATATRAADVVEVKVATGVDVAFDCSRCAEPARLHVEAAFTHHFVGEPDNFAADWPAPAIHHEFRLELALAQEALNLAKEPA